jgi:hypothetical protein
VLAQVARRGLAPWTAFLRVAFDRATGKRIVGQYLGWYQYLHINRKNSFELYPSPNFMHVIYAPDATSTCGGHDCHAPLRSFMLP